MRRMRVHAGLLLVLVTLTGAEPGAPPPAADPLPPEYARMIDSMLALPDSAWMPDMPGINRRGMREFYARMRRAPESTFAGPDAAHRSDAEMMLVFRKRERDFERLLAMFLADSACTRVDLQDDPIYNLPSRLPPDRQARYERLMRPLGVRILYREGRDAIVFRSTTVFTFDRKGYLWSRVPVRPVVEDETTSETNRHQFRVHRALKGRWYLYYQSSS